VLRAELVERKEEGVMSDKRVLVDWLLGAFESKYKDKWREERFSVLGDAACGHPHADLDFIFFWKIYDQGWFAGQSGSVFEELTSLASGGPKMVRSLAGIPPEDAKNLKSTFERQGLPPRVQAAFRQVRGGWYVCGWAVKAAKKLCGLYGVEETSYIAQWLANCICSRQWTGNWGDLIHCINGGVEAATRDLKGDWQQLPFVAKGFLEQKLVNPPGVHLTGAGPNVVSFFFRDWKDVILWKYMWKHDEKNNKFWRLVSQVLGPSGIGPHGSDQRTVLHFLGSALTSNEIESGSMAKINTTVYRLLADLGEEGIKATLQGMI